MNNVLITFVPDYYPSNTGFAQAFYHMHSSILQNNVCDHVYVYADGQYKSPDEKKITVKKIPTTRGQGLLRYSVIRPLELIYITSRYKKIIDEIRTISRSSNVQMILIESMFLAWLVPMLKKELPTIPVVCRIHGTGPEYTAYYRNLEGRKFREYLLDCVFSLKYIAATTKYYFDFFRDYYKCYDKFMDKEFFILPNTTLSETSQCDDNATDVINLFQLGRLDMRGYHQKGFSDTVKALLYIEKTHPTLASKIVYTTLGTGDREKEFLNRVSSLELIKHVHYSKLNNDEVKKIERQSDVILVPSRCEGMSMFATEAIAAGKPLICTTGNGLESIGENCYNAYYVTEYDYVRMANAIVRMVENRDILKTMSRNSLEFYRENCSYEAVSNKYDVIVKYLSNHHDNQ